MYVLIVGAGYMAKEYAKVLKDMAIPFEICGRSEVNAKKLQEELGVPVIHGGLEGNFKNQKNYTHAIIATSLESLEDNVHFLLDKNVENILLEKPGAVTTEGLKKITLKAKEKKSKVYIAYNRRFYSSVIEAKKRIDNEGGLKSFQFEFTEWSHLITKMDISEFTMNNLFVGNSTHVLDTAFYFGGEPKTMNGFVQSNLDWHPKGSLFVGSGITNKNILFSYHANWEAPGSWKLELLTTENRYIFRPFEELKVQKLGSVEIENVQIDNSLDIQYKPGLYKQIEQFLFEKQYSELLEVEKASRMFNWYEHILKQGREYQCEF